MHCNSLKAIVGYVLAVNTLFILKVMITYQVDTGNIKKTEIDVRNAVNISDAMTKVIGPTDTSEKVNKSDQKPPLVQLLEYKPATAFKLSKREEKAYWAFVQKQKDDCELKVKNTTFRMDRFCPCTSPLLVGPVPMDLTVLPWETLDNQWKGRVLPGGEYYPPDCTARHKVAVIIPYRERPSHLRVLLPQLHSVMQHQQIHYAVFVIEPPPSPLFNKGITMNSGFLEVATLFDPDCFIFHDVDLLPEDDRNMYTCDSKAVVHFTPYSSKYDYELKWGVTVGGGIAVTAEQYQKLNGFSNEYYGWGGEDDDMAHRVKASKLPLVRRPRKIATFTTISHTRDANNTKNPFNGALLRRTWGKSDFGSDGVSTVQYKVDSVDRRTLFTHIRITPVTPFNAFKAVSPKAPCKGNVFAGYEISVLDCVRNCSSNPQCQAFSYDLRGSYHKHCELRTDKCVSNETSPDYAFWIRND